MREVRVSLGERTYPIFIDPGMLECAGPLIVRHGLSSRTVVISDKTVNGLFAKVLLESLRSEGIDATLFAVPDGEHSKSLEQTEKLYTKLIKFGLKRDGLVIALGGGVIQSSELFWDKMLATIRTMCGLVPYEKTQILPATLGKDVALLGAAQVWIKRFRQ